MPPSLDLRPIKVIAPGSEVVLIGGIRASVVAVMIEDFGRVSYKAAWVKGADIEEKWVSAFMIDETSEKIVKVGFGRVVS